MSNQLTMAEPEPLAAAGTLLAAEHKNPTADCASRPASPIPAGKHLIQFILLSALALLSYLFVSHFVLQSVRVVGESMFPTLHDADYYFLNRIVCYVHAPKRQDIVVIKDPSDGVFVVKRIVAMPGESIYFKKG